MIVWDVPGGRPRATFAGHGGRIAGVALSPDARTAYSARFDGTVIAWDLAGPACAVAGRALTRAEWEEALPERDYAPACARR